MFVIFVALLRSALHGISTMIDSRLSNYEFKNISSIVFFGMLTSFIFIPIILLFGKIPPLNIQILPFLFIFSLLNVFYLFPYYTATKKIDTSIVNSLFALGYVFVPIFAYIMLGDKFSVTQTIGCLIILIFSIFLNLEKRKKIALNPAFFLMLFVVFLISIQTVIEKSLLNSFDWVGFAFYFSLMSFLISLCLLLFKKARNGIISDFPKFKANFKFFLLNEFLMVGGNLAGIYSLSKLSVLESKAIGSTQPFFVLFFSLLLVLLFHTKLKEKHSAKSIIKKLICFCAIIIGILLVMH